MLRSRTFTPAFRFFGALALFSFVAAVVVGFSSETQSPIDRIVGPLTLGWKGGVGNHLAYTLFVGLFAASAGLAGLLVAFRDADPEAEAQVVRTDSVPLTRAPAGMNYLPAFGAAGVVATFVGFGSGTTVLGYSGIAFLVVIGFVWTLRAWAERATGDDATNAELYHRFIDPLRVPVVAIVSVGVVIIGVSRVLLAVSKTGSLVVFSVMAIVVFGITIVLALVPRSGRYVLTGLVVLGAVLVIAGGIIGAVAGEREFEKHGDHSTETGTEAGVDEGASASAATDSGLPPLVVTVP